MNIIIIDLLFVTIALLTLALVPMYAERNHRAAWRGRMKRAALRHCVRGSSEYGQQRYIAMRGVK